jgi:carbonic anhydrase/acetyltransferase-like protein (isoleucine patch superfamily)
MMLYSPSRITHPILPLKVLMFISHKGKKPEVHPSAYIAPTATICGDVSIGPNCQIKHLREQSTKSRAVIIDQA